MNKRQRQSAILAQLQSAELPLTGAQLAAEHGVSRQIIIKDIAKLRQDGANILSTTEGYVIPAGSAQREIVCRHVGRERLEVELYTIVEHGGVVLDVMVEHPLYGQLRTPLNLRSRRDVARFADELYGSGSQPMSALTDGVHIHTVRAADGKALDAIEQALLAEGILGE